MSTKFAKYQAIFNLHTRRRESLTEKHPSLLTDNVERDAGRQGLLVLVCRLATVHSGVVMLHGVDGEEEEGEFVVRAPRHQHSESGKVKEWLIK